MNAENDLRLLMEELVDLFDWSDPSPTHAILHVRNAVLNLRADLAVQKARAEKAEANYAFMVERAADQRLDGYRELGARAAAAENEADRLRARLRETAQILIEAVGADGPMDAEDAARKAVECIEDMKSKEGRALAEDFDDDFHALTELYYKQQGGETALTDSTPCKNPSKFETLWFQCTQCGWGEEDWVGDWKDGQACPHCGVGLIKSSRMDGGK